MFTNGVSRPVVLNGSLEMVLVVTTGGGGGATSIWWVEVVLLINILLGIGQPLQPKNIQPQMPMVPRLRNLALWKREYRFTALCLFSTLLLIRKFKNIDLGGSVVWQTWVCQVLGGS